ncbi:hypothetical protein IGI04_017874 [Brassica rapa subsp. trilocularis]|uniref:EF-hand domain-containing protein n=1 Tax=Brassica rapa subsp. trilocularis TaxID=1813537 RepID=A0ABQ7MBA4_BRACM|nr:hypothetical protein IGI04_017874 [Brassica rapa subsp. trilocularis]
MHHFSGHPNVIQIVGVYEDAVAVHYRDGDLCRLSEEEITGLEEMFKMIDTDNRGQITLEELKKGLDRVGAILKA